jgi:hypothetical protein
MRICDLTYEEARRRHPVEVDKIIAALRRGKSKHKTAALEDLTWSYGCCVVIENGCYTWDQIMSGEAALDGARLDARSVDDKVADQVRRTRTNLEAQVGRWRGSEPVENPPEIEADARAYHEKADRERAEFEALPEAEQQRQIDGLLGALRGKPGFVELRLSDPTGKPDGN